MGVFTSLVALVEANLMLRYDQAFVLTTSEGRPNLHIGSLFGSLL